MPLPIRIFPDPNVVAPVPPLATGKVPDTSVANATVFPPDKTPVVDLTMPLVNPDKVNPVNVGELANPNPILVRAVALFCNEVTPALVIATSPDIATAVAALPALPTKIFAGAKVEVSLLLNIVKLAADKYPSTAPVAAAIEMAGVAPPEDTIGAVPVTLVTVPPPSLTQDKTPAPFVFNTCPDVPSAAGNSQTKLVVTAVDGPLNPT